MTLTLELPPDVESALAEDARRKGTTPEELALDNLRRSYVPPSRAVGPPREDPTLAIFAQWDAEDATDDPEEIARRIQEWEETKANLQANRFSLEGRTDFRALLGDDQEDDSQEKAS
jgi:hypothetical protein